MKTGMIGKRNVLQKGVRKGLRRRARAEASRARMSQTSLALGKGIPGREGQGQRLEKNRPDMFQKQKRDCSTGDKEGRR